MKKDDFRKFGGNQPPRMPQMPMVAIDRFGQQIEPGHLIMFHVQEDLVFEVISVGPVLNPSISGGRGIQVVLQAQFPVMFPPAMANRAMVVCGESRARMEAKAAKNGKPDSPPDPVAPPRESGLILLTDQHDAPKAAPKEGKPGHEEPEELCGPASIVSMCDKCGHTDGDVGTVCGVCGDGTYQRQQ